MGAENKPNYSYSLQNFTHCMAVEDLPEFSVANNAFWERQSAGPKIGAERFLVEGAGFFPDRLVTTRSVIQIGDIPLIEATLSDGIAHKYSMGVRTIAEKPISFGNKLPWEMEINSPKKIETFLSETLPSWQEYGIENGFNITQLILMKNLPEIGTILPQKDQFVARLKWENFEPDGFGNKQLILEMTNGTNKLRDLDKRMEDRNTCRKNIIRYEATYSPLGIFQNARIQIGSNYLAGIFREPREIRLQQQFSFSEQQRRMFMPEKLQYIDTMFEFLNNATNDPYIQFLKRLDFLSSIGLPAIEFQGYADRKTHKRYARIYGLRGNNDETNTGLTPFTKNIE